MAAVRIGKISEILPSFLQNKSYSKIAVVADKNTVKFCYPKIKPYLPKHTLITIQSGEEFKTLDTCINIWQKLTDSEFDRHALVINLGGGVIGDMGGFCSATYKRGIDFIQIPTTLLAQVDASVGGKLAIDFQSYKNHIGVFTLPEAVLIDSEFLQTLPHEELRSGFAEIIKHCLIRDQKMWDFIRKKDLEEMPFQELINHSVSIKNEIVTEDPTERGLRKILNFGHTIGHAVESYFLEKKPLRHGEAIAVGMICEAYIAYHKKLISLEELVEIEEYIFTTFGRVEIKSEEFAAIIELTAQDKKNQGKKIKAALLNGVGNCAFDIEISKKEIENSLRYYCGVV